MCKYNWILFSKYVAEFPPLELIMYPVTAGLNYSTFQDASAPQIRQDDERVLNLTAFMPEEFAFIFCPVSSHSNKLPVKAKVKKSKARPVNLARSLSRVKKLPCSQDQRGSGFRCFGNILVHFLINCLKHCSTYS